MTGDFFAKDSGRIFCNSPRDVTLYAPLSRQEPLTLTLAQKWKSANVNKQLASSTMEKVNRAPLKWKNCQKTVKSKHNVCCKHNDCYQSLLKHSFVTSSYSECSENVCHQAPRLMNTAHYTTKPVRKLTKNKVKKITLIRGNINVSDYYDGIFIGWVQSHSNNCFDTCGMTGLTDVVHFARFQ